VKIPAGGTAKFHVTAQVGKMFENLQIELSEPPDGISIRKIPKGRARSKSFLRRMPRRPSPVNRAILS